MCKVEGCDRPTFSRGLCGPHALQGYYRTEAIPGAGLSAVRVVAAPRILPRASRTSTGKRRTSAILPLR
jgi:hypothetical protein